MKKRIHHFFQLVFLILGITSSVQAQVSFSSSCLYNEKMEEYRQEFPQEYERINQLKNQARVQANTEAREKNSDDCCLDGVLIIPIYFHVLHNSGNPNTAGDDNFTIAELQSAVDNLNKDFGGNNADMERVLQEFIDEEDVSINTCIQFCWRTTHLKRENINDFPNSLFTSNGAIVDAYFMNGFRAISSPILQCSFMNVYTGNMGGTLLGYANDMGTSAAGVYIDDNPFVPGGPLNVPKYNQGRTMTHEVGHYLGLAHIWGNTNNQGTTSSSHCGIDDGISDTPNQGRSTVSDPQPALGAIINQCGANIMYSNYMDYSNDTILVNYSTLQSVSMVNFVNGIISTTCTNGFNEDFCQMDFNDCEDALSVSATVSACVETTINLLSYENSWFAASTNYPSPVTCYSWTLDGEPVPFPAKTKVQHSNSTCLPETYVFTLWIECSIVGHTDPEASGTVSVTVYRNPDDIVEQYLNNGDCGGPTVDYDNVTCESLVTFTPINAPMFPVTESGALAYTITFDPSILGPCCTAPCTKLDTAQYFCETITGPCGGIAFSGGTSQFILGSCLSDDFSETFDNYISSQSFSDPMGVFEGFYFFKDAALTELFNLNEDMSFTGDSCVSGTGPIIYTAVGCDTDGNGFANVIGSLGTINFSDMSVDPKAPSISMTQSPDGTCNYSWAENCFSEEFSPFSIASEDCGSIDLGLITVEVSNVNTSCIKEYRVRKPDCPYCFIASCVESDFSSGSETLCSSGLLSAGLPDITITGSSGPTGDIIWLYDENFDGPLNVYYTPTHDLDTDPPPLEHSDLTSGLPEDQILYAYTLCDSDNDASTPAVWAELGTYTVTVNPIPDGRITAVCNSGDDDNFYIDVALFSNAQGNTFTATNSFNSATLSFTSPGIQQLGPFSNGTDVTVTFGIDGGCSMTSAILSQGCSPGTCSNPEVDFTKICTSSDMTSFNVDVALVGSTSGLLYSVSNNQDSEILELDPLNPSGQFGPYTEGTDVQITVTDYADSRCLIESGSLPHDCTIVGIEDPSTSAENEDSFEIISIFPNPTSGILNVQLNSRTADQFGINIFDLLGRKVWSNTRSVGFGISNIVIEKIDLSTGVYFLSIFNTKENEPKVLKFVKVE